MNTTIKNRIAEIKAKHKAESDLETAKYEKNGTCKINISHAVIDESGYYYVGFGGDFVGWKSGEDKIIIKNGNNTDTLFIKSRWNQRRINITTLSCKRIERVTQLELI